MPLIVEDGSIIANADTYISVADFDTWLLKYDYVIAGNKEPLLRHSFDFLSALKWCKPHNATYKVENAFIYAQCRLAYAMSADGGGFDPNEILEAKQLTKKGLGRGAIVKEWDINKDLSKSDLISILKRLPLVYGLLKTYLCSSGASRRLLHN